MANGEQQAGRVFNIGDFLHVVQIGILLVSLGMIYEKFQQTLDLTGTHSRQLNRIEHYLSSKDPEYWKQTKEEDR